MFQLLIIPVKNLNNLPNYIQLNSKEKPPSINPLINSILAKVIEKIKIDERSFFNLNLETIKVIKPIKIIPKTKELKLMQMV